MHLTLVCGSSAPGSVSACLEVSVEVSSVDQRVDAAAEGGRQEHEVRHYYKSLDFKHSTFLSVQLVENTDN